MSKKYITAELQDDGTLLKHLPDGTEEVYTPGPIGPMTEAELEAAMNDEENPPLTEERMKHMRPVSRVKAIRRHLGITQEQFAERYGIPLGTLRDWEQGRSYPDQSALTLLDAITYEPKTMARIVGASRPKRKPKEKVMTA